MGIWCKSSQSQPDIPNPEHWGWAMKENTWIPLWMTQSEAAKACKELIKCACKSVRGCIKCKCIKLGFSCTELCSCSCNK